MSQPNSTQLPHLAVKSEQPALEEMPITKHLMVLRKHLFKIVGLIIALFFCLLPFANKTYQVLSEPLRAQLPHTSTMIATDVTATFMAPFKLNFFVALLIAMPFILYQLWAFVKPALYEKEKSLALPLLIVLYRHQFCLFCCTAVNFAFFHQCVAGNGCPDDGY